MHRTWSPRERCRRERGSRTSALALPAHPSRLVNKKGNFALERQYRRTHAALQGRSRGSLTSKIVAVVDALGCLVRFVILPGQAHDLAGAPDLIEDLRFGALVGDKAFDAHRLLEEVEGRGAVPMTPPKRNRTAPRDHGREMYKWRHQIENFLARIKEFRTVATRHDNADESFAAGIDLVADVIAAT